MTIRRTPLTAAEREAAVPLNRAALDANREEGMRKLRREFPDKTDAEIEALIDSSPDGVDTALELMAKSPLFPPASGTTPPFRR